MNNLCLTSPKCLLALAIMIGSSSAVKADEDQPLDNDQIISMLEEVVVTGTRIKRTQQRETATPLTTIGIDDMAARAIKDTRDLVDSLPINAGSENNADILSQNFTTGTANVNLRGLGVASTLVLLNGRRQVLSAAPTDDGSSFVDISQLVPALAIERTEILKDGASAIYGSDAVAGVFNFITRDDLEGGELQFEYRDGKGDQRDINIDGVFGASFGDNGHFLAAASYLHRTPLYGADLDWVDPIANSSGFGNPATFRGVETGEIYQDPQCEEYGGFFLGTSPFCRRDFGPHLTFVPEERRLQTFTRAIWDWSDSTQVWVELGYSRNDIYRGVSTTSPTLITTVVPEENPGNTLGEDVNYLGRVYWPGFENTPEDNNFQHTTTRFALGAQGDFNDSLSWDFSFINGQNDFQLNYRDVVVDRFQNALNGFGGFLCNPGVDEPGVGDCQYFNPFASNFSAEPGDPLYNDPSLRDYMITEALGLGKSQLDVFEANITGSFGELDGGEIGFALGAQYRQQQLGYVYDGLMNADAFGFIIGGQNFSGDLDVSAIYGEIALPLTRQLEIGAAVRFEDYGGDIGSSTDPKLSVLWAPANRFSMRASYSTSFRAPTVFQTQGVQSGFANISDPTTPGQGGTFVGIRTFGNEELEPETSEAFNFGMSFNPMKSLAINLDYWDFSFEDAIAREAPQAIVDDVGDDFDDPRVVRSVAGTIVLVNTEFFNANAIDTSGLDLNVSYSVELGSGTLRPSLDLTYVLDYDLTTPSGDVIDGAGNRNRTNFGTSTPELRGNLGVTWMTDNQTAGLFANYISSYDNDRDNNTAIDSHLTWDVQYSLGLGEFLKSETETTLTVGVVNLTDEDPPQTFAVGGGSFDSKIHDPRGRRAYLKVSTQF